MSKGGEPEKMGRRLFLIGLDGATFDLIRPWVQKGRLPTFASLMREGVWGALRSVIHPYTAQAWSSLATGKNAGKHRIIDFQERDFDGYGLRLLNASTRVGKTLWEMLSEARKRVIVMNVPMTYPPVPVNGLLVSGRDTPGMDAQYTFPPNLKEELCSALGEYVIVPNDWLYMRQGRPQKARQELLKEVDLRFTAMKYLVENYPWDFAMFVVGATDGAAHFFWRYFDPTYPLYDQKEADKYGDTLQRVYQQVDRRLGDFLDSLPQDTIIMLVSDHGNGPMTDRAIYLNAWLERQGLLHLRESKRSPKIALATLMAKAGRSGKELLYSRLPFQTLTKVRALFPHRARRVLAAASLAKVDWSRTRVFSEEMRGNIWINLAGRDPQGIVEPEEYEGLRKLIIERLSEIRDPETGALLIKAVHRREEIFEGPFVEGFPDLLVEAEVASIFRPCHDPQGVEPVTILSPEELRQLAVSGAHRMNGIFLAKGPNLRAGVKIEGGGLVDIAPTVLYLMGESIPKDMDGRVLEEILEPSFLANNPITFGDIEPEERTDYGREAYTEEEQREIEERLKGMGYLE